LHGKFCNGREVSAGKSLISDFTQLFEIDNTINGVERRALSFTNDRLFSAI